MSLHKIGLALLLAGCLFVPGVMSLGTPAIADDDEGVIEDTYIAPLDLNGSDEDVREQGSSGFDTPGPVVVDPDYYDSTEPDSSDDDSGD
jgi:hypothetical protein